MNLNQEQRSESVESMLIREIRGKAVVFFLLVQTGAERLLRIAEPGDAHKICHPEAKRGTCFRGHAIVS